MKDGQHIFSRGALLAAALLYGAAANAIPVLQIDIDGASYDSSPGEQSVVTTDPAFTLYALGTPGGNVTQQALLADTYYLSVAIIPQSGPGAVNFGTFTVGGVTYDSSNMVYGVPPIDFNQGQDPQDLSDHDIFDTLFLELEFQFNLANTSGEYNVEDTPGIGSQAGTGSFYQSFDFNVSGLLAGFDLHFDLYSTVIRNGGDVDRDDFAPFSHDARTQCCTTNITTVVPEPGMLPLMLVGVISLLAKRKLRP